MLPFLVTTMGDAAASPLRLTQPRGAAPDQARSLGAAVFPSSFAVVRRGFDSRRSVACSRSGVTPAPAIRPSQNQAQIGDARYLADVQVPRARGTRDRGRCPGHILCQEGRDNLPRNVTLTQRGTAGRGCPAIKVCFTRRGTCILDV